MKNQNLRYLLLLLCTVLPLAALAQLSDTALAEKIAARGQISDVPTLYLTIPDVTTLDTDLMKDRSTNTALYHRAYIQLVDESDASAAQHLESFTDSVNIKVRGNSTADVSKRPYRLKFDKDEKDTDGNVALSHKHDLLGYGYKKRNWALMANYFDRSMLRNALTYHLGKYVGMAFCPGYKFVDLVINEEYRGTYQVTDQVEAGSNRVDIDKDKDWMLEFVSWSNMLDASTSITAGTNNVPYNTNIKNPDYEGDELTQLISDVSTWEIAWNNSFQSNSSSTGWPAYNDVESFIKFYIAMQITGDWDGFFVMKGYRTPDGPFFWGPLWDKDLAYGNYGTDGILVEEYENGMFRWNFSNFLQKDIKFVEKAKNLIDSLINENIYDKLVSNVDDIAGMLDSTRKQNYAKWPISGDCGIAKYGSYTDYADYVQQVKDYLKGRIPFVQTKMDSLYNTLIAAKTSNTYDPTLGQWDTGVLSLSALTNKLSDITVSPANTVTGSAWSTLFLPFDVTESQMKEAIGGAYELRTFSKMDGETFVFAEPSSKDIAAATPYLIRMSDASASAGPMWTFTDVIVPVTTDNAVTFSYDDYGLTGIYHAVGLKTDGTVYKLADDALTVPPAESWATGSSDKANYINGAQFYFTVPSGTTPAILFDGETAARGQLTDVPTVYIDTDNAADIVKGDYVNAAIEVIDNNGKLDSFTEESGYLEVKIQGSENADKLSYRLKFAKKHKHALLDASGYTKRQWVLLGNGDDATMLRNALAKELGDAVGMAFTPGYCFVDLVINGEYKGTYQVTDRVQTDGARVNVDEDTGWLLEMTNKADEDELQVTGDESTPYINIKNPDQDDLSDEEKAALQTAVSTFASTLWSDTESAVDKTSFIQWYIASEILGGNAAWKNFYTYKEADAATLCFGPLWDNEKSFNNNKLEMTAEGLMSDLDTEGSYNGLTVNAANDSQWKTLLQNLWKEQWFAEGVVNMWETFYGDNKTTDVEKTLTDAVSTLSETVAQTQALNYQTLTWPEEFTDYAAAAQEITDYIAVRFPYLDRKFHELAGIDYLHYDVTLTDALTQYAGKDGAVVTVVLDNRGTVHAGEWNAVCLPFDLDETGFAEVFGEDCKLQAFTGVATSDEGDVTFKFTDTETKQMSDGVPYLMMPSEDVSDLTFSNVTFNKSDAHKVVSDGYSFVGTLNATTIPANDTHLVLMRDNTLYRLTKEQTLHGCRAYFILPEGTTAKSVGFSVEEGGTTSVVSVPAVPASDVRIYTISGQPAGKSLDNLPKGVYIINGQKKVK